MRWMWIIACLMAVVFVTAAVEAGGRACEINASRFDHAQEVAAETHRKNDQRGRRREKVKLRADSQIFFYSSRTNASVSGRKYHSLI